MKNSRKPARYYTLKQWKKIIKNWEKSGLSRHAYCVQKNLIESTFCNWQKKIAPSSSQASLGFMKKSEGNLKFSLQDLFVAPMEDSGISINSSSSNQKMEVIFAQGHRLSLEGPFNWEDLRAWLTPLLMEQD